MRCRQFACCRSGKRRSTHVTTYPSRGVGLHTRRPREATTSLAIPEVLQQGKGRISQPFWTGHQFRRNSAFKRGKGGVRSGLHRVRSYGPCTRKRYPGHLRMPFCPGTYWRRQKLGSYLRKPCLQHPRGRTTLSCPKRWRVPGTRASLEMLWATAPQSGQDLAPFGGSGNDKIRGGLGKSFYS